MGLVRRRRLAALGDIVVVTANYRLGPLGYLYLPEIGAANLGPQDQAAVLAWVRDNIASFGGDPRNVTVGGQSAGAYSALSLALDPRTSGLVTRVLLQSGPFGLRRRTRGTRPRTPKPICGCSMCRRSGCAKKLRTLPVEQLLSAYGRLAGQLARPGNAAPPMYPVLGGPGVPRDLQRALADGALEGKALLIGTTRDEATAFTAFDPRIQNLTSAGALDLLTGQLGEQAHEVYQRYAARLAQPTAAQVFTAVQTDELFRNDSLRIADHHAAGGNATYVYQFDYRPAEDEHALGATHCAELPFLFNTFDAYPDSPMLGRPTDAVAGPGPHLRDRGRRVRHDRIGERLAALRARDGRPHPALRLRQEPQPVERGRLRLPEGPGAGCPPRSAVRVDPGRRAVGDAETRLLGEVQEGVPRPEEAVAGPCGEPVVDHRLSLAVADPAAEPEVRAADGLRVTVPLPASGPGVPVVGDAPDRRDALLQAARVGEGVAGPDLGAARLHSVPEPFTARRPKRGPASAVGRVGGDPDRRQGAHHSATNSARP
jgi:hypothetical protein